MGIQLSIQIGTMALAESARQAIGPIPFIVVGDSFKRWSDVMPPPLEDIFECVPAGELY